jgi:2,4-dienoyl-CoA reductase (NADPH2)
VDAADDLAGFDEVVLATGITPRDPTFPRHDHPKVLSYLDVLERRVIGRPPRRRSSAPAASASTWPSSWSRRRRRPRLDPARWMAEWGVDPPSRQPAAWCARTRNRRRARSGCCSARPAKPGARLGKTTGWIHRATLKAKGVKMLGGVEYLGVDDAGLHVRVDGSEQTCRSITWWSAPARKKIQSNQWLPKSLFSWRWGKRP